MQLGHSDVGHSLRFLDHRSQGSNKSVADLASTAPVTTDSLETHHDLFWTTETPTTQVNSWINRKENERALESRTDVARTNQEH